MSDQAGRQPKTYSPALNRDQPLLVDRYLAVAIGLNESIVLKQIEYWVTNPNIKQKRHEGRRWFYNSARQWREDNFPFWSETGIKKILTRLRKSGLILAANLNRHTYDRTLWYAIDYDALDAVIVEKLPADHPYVLAILGLQAPIGNGVDDGQTGTPAIGNGVDDGKATALPMQKQPGCPPIPEITQRVSQQLPAEAEAAAVPGDDVVVASLREEEEEAQAPEVGSDGNRIITRGAEAEGPEMPPSSEPAPESDWPALADREVALRGDDIQNPAAYKAAILKKWRAAGAPTLTPESNGSGPAWKAEADAAWELVDRQIRSGGYRLVKADPTLWAVIQRMSGWPRFRNTPPDQWHWLRREFDKEWKALATAKQQEPAPVPAGG